MRSFLIASIAIYGLIVSPSLLVAQQNAVATTVDGRSLEGTITYIGDDGAIGGLTEPINIADVLSITWSRKAAALDKTVKVYTVGGGVIGCDSVSIADDQLSIQTGSQKSQYPLQVIRGIAWPDSGVSEAFQRALKTPSKENDTVVVEVENGARAVSGILETIDSKEVGLNYEGRSRSIAREKVRGVVMANLGFTAASGPKATLAMIDGTTWVGVIQSLNNDQLTLQLTKQSNVQVPFNKVLEISVFSDRLRYLSDMVPIDVRETSQFAIQRPYRLNRSVSGKPDHNAFAQRQIQNLPERHWGKSFI